MTERALPDKAYRKNGKVKKRYYEAELARMQEELVKLQYWVKEKGLKVVILFEGRGSAGKGGVIKRITEQMSPRIVRVVALPTPTEREKSQWWFQNMWPTCPLPARSSSSTAVGTTAPMWSG